jgi:multidrug efflux pump subunit AcrB
MDAARKRPELGNLFTSFDPRYPQVKVDLDREKARKLGVPINEAFQALSASMGGTYVNDFNRFGRLFRVYVQSEADYRRKPKDIGDIYVRSRTTNQMIPLSTLVTITSEGGTEITVRFNLFRSVEINGVSAAVIRPASPWLHWRRSSSRPCRRRWVSPIPVFPIRKKSRRRRDRP